MQTISLLGSTLGLAMLSGINLYAAALTIGVCVRLNLVTLPAELQGLTLLAEPGVLIAAGTLYLIEFVADKIPWVDSLWDTIHTFVRPLGAAAIGFTALQGVDPAWEVAAALLCGGIGLTSHSTKAGTRLVVNQSPEPFTNIIVSLAEDAIVIVGTWLFLEHPLVGLIAVGVFLLAMVWIAPKLWRLLELEFAAAKGLLVGVFAGQQGAPTDDVSELPRGFRKSLEKIQSSGGETASSWAFSGKGAKPGRFFRGILVAEPGRLTFITRRRFRTRCYEAAVPPGAQIEFVERLFLSQLRIEAQGLRVRYYCTREQIDALQRLAARLKQGAHHARNDKRNSAQ